MSSLEIHDPDLLHALLLLPFRFISSDTIPKPGQSACWKRRHGGQGPQSLESLKDMAETGNRLEAGMSHSQVDLEAMFSQIYLYPWDQDPEFQSGLSSIFGNAESSTFGPSSRPDSHLLIQAQCFYYARKYNLPVAIDAAVYKEWLSKRACGEPNSTPTDTIITRHHQPIDPHSSCEPTPPPPTLPQTNPIPLSDSPELPLNSAAPSILPQNSTLPSSSPPTAPTAATPPTGTQPQYPTSFASVVDLITRNQPIPGIEEIPDTVLDASLSKPDKAPRRRKPWEEKCNTQVASAVTTYGEGKVMPGNPSNSSTWMQATERSKDFDVGK